MTVLVRDAEVRAISAATLDIYNELMSSTTGAWRSELQTLDERREWFDEQTRRGFVTLVAVDGDEVVGMTSYGDFRDSLHWPGYRFTAEHLDPRARRPAPLGHRADPDGRADRARWTNSIHVLVAGIDSENVESIRFHERLGFVEVARMPETGYKFGRRLDLVLMQQILGSE